MPVMLTTVINLEEESADMKAALKRLSKERKEKDAQIKQQNRQITYLKKKLQKWSSEPLNKDSGGEDSDKESNHSKESDDECNP